MSWREFLVRFALVFFCFALWPKGFMYWGVALLVVAWLVDGGLFRFRGLLKEPLVLGILIFCGVWVVGLLWSDLAVAFQDRWRKYFLLLAFLPLYSLLNKERLPWAVGGLAGSYSTMVALGGYSWSMQGMQGVPLFGMIHLHYSAALGIGVILAIFGSWVVLAKGNKFLTVLLWLVALLLLFLQFHQNSRGFLLTTLVTSLLMFYLYYRTEGKLLLRSVISILAVAMLFAATSDAFHERLEAAKSDLQLSRQGNYQTSVGYRLAIWDIGLHGIAERPLLGHGSGMAKQYLKDSYITYKQGIYRNLSEFHEARHFHNELIEIGIHLGLLGILAFAFLLWSWFKTFRQHQMTLLGSAIVCFIFLSGLTDTFLITNRIPPFLLAVTAIAVCWQKYNRGLDLVDRKNLQIENITQNP
ncbi:MAG TPA: O-antigen ligase family protein [Bellilinea sp.]|nr:O-antigen ligase family protein [Bellilinea sp.]